METNKLRILLFFLFIILVVIIARVSWTKKSTPAPTSYIALNKDQTHIELMPLSLLSFKQKIHPGSQITIEETLAQGINYQRFIASYFSDGYKIYGLLTIPNESKNNEKFPIILFLHGYLPPKEYKTLERYVAYQDGLAKSGYITFKPDLRGHGESEGKSVVSNFAYDYVSDSLNAIASLQTLPQANQQKIGVWGHSMGGGIGLRSIIASPQIKAGVFWAGVVGNYEDLIERYRKRIPWMSSSINSETKNVLNDILEKYGSPSANSPFWTQIDPYSYLNDVQTPIQLHHGDEDTDVPVEFSQHLYQALVMNNKEVEFYAYPKTDHNLSQSFSVAMRRSIDFFDKYLKN